MNQKQRIQRQKDISDYLVTCSQKNSFKKSPIKTEFQNIKKTKQNTTEKTTTTKQTQEHSYKLFDKFRLQNVLWRRVGGVVLNGQRKSEPQSIPRIFSLSCLYNLSLCAIVSCVSQHLLQWIVKSMATFQN